jgi:hypothetical protein
MIIPESLETADNDIINGVIYVKKVIKNMR